MSGPGIILMIHSIVRWLILIVALAAIVKFALGLAQKRAYDKMSNGLMAGFSGLMDLQALLGIIVLLWDGFAGVGFPMYRIEHAITLLLAVVVAHLPARWKKAADNVRYRNGLLAILGSLLLVVLGIMVLPGNRWTLSR